MVNGEDKNLVRLVICVAEYRAKYREWPTQARLAPFLLWDIAHQLDPAQFERLAERLTLSSATDVYLVEMQGKQGVHSYGETEIKVPDSVSDETPNWLGLSARADELTP